MGWRWGEANGDVWRAVLSTVWSIAVVYGLYVGWRGLGGGEQGGAFLLSDALTAELLTSTGSEGPLSHPPPTAHLQGLPPPFKMQEEAALSSYPLPQLQDYITTPLVPSQANSDALSVLISKLIQSQFFSNVSKEKFLPWYNWTETPLSSQDKSEDDSNTLD